MTIASEDMSTKRMVNKGKPCSVTGCPNGALTKGMCQMHYTRWLNTGDAGPAQKRPSRPVYDRAMDKVDQSAGPDACHPWTGMLIKGLPTINNGGRQNRTTMSVRRVIAEEHGLIGKDEGQTRWIQMRDGCDPRCCNVKHMKATGKARPFLDRDDA